MSFTIKTFNIIGIALTKNCKLTYGKNKLFNNARTLSLSALQCAKVPYILSDIGEGIREVVVKEWFVKEGDRVAQFDNICEVASDKASVTITSRYDGVVTKLLYKVDDTALVGKPLVEIETDSSDDPAAVTAASKPESPPTATEQSSPETPITGTTIGSTNDLCIPSVRRLAKEHAVNVAQVKGTGRNGRVLKEDVLRFLGLSADDIASQRPSPQLRNLPQQSDRTEPIKGFQKAMVQTMTQALKIPHFVYSDELRVTQLTSMRREVRAFLEQSGNVKLSAMPFFIKAASNALRRFPVLNATVDEGCANVTYRAAHNIGVAMDTKVGLAVPVIKNVQHLSVMEIALELNRLMQSGKQGNFKPDDLANGTFSISNIGAIGGTYMKPVILAPQVSIIAIGATKTVPRFDKDMKVIAEDIVNISGAADHRVVDGATMAKFVNLLKRQIENPYFLFLDL